MPFLSINPATEEALASFTTMTATQADRCAQDSHDAFHTWHRYSIKKRARLLKKIADILISEQTQLAHIITQEVGKPIAEARAEIKKCAVLTKYFAKHASRFLRPEDIKTDAKKSFVCFEPLGVVLGIMPWNFPFWQVFRFAVPALLAGNTILIKHAENVGMCALAIVNLFEQAQFPHHVVTNLFITPRTAHRLIASEHVHAVTFTGSVEAGSKVAESAGNHIKKVVLELGGSDPYLILHDAQLKTAAQRCVHSRLINSGQSCIAAKRFIVVESVRKKFESLLIKEMKRAVIGDPANASTRIGPLARKDLRAHLHRQVSQSIRLGATCVLGGSIPDGAGFFYPPTVLTQVQAGMPAFDQELFGPVAAIISAHDESEAIDIANANPYGLGAAVFTKDIKRGLAIAQHKINAGSCFVNDFVRSDPRLPFGGIKKSGYGRELAHYGIKEFVNVKTIYLGK